jgi:hypothetical protein
MREETEKVANIEEATCTPSPTAGFLLEPEEEGKKLNLFHLEFYRGRHFNSPIEMLLYNQMREARKDLGLSKFFSPLGT